MPGNRLSQRKPFVWQRRQIHLTNAAKLGNNISPTSIIFNYFMSIKAPTMFDLSRKEASEILKVSTRTLDRYIKSKKVSSKSIAGRIMLNRDEVSGMKKTRKHRKIRKNSQALPETKKEVFEINNSIDEAVKAEEKVYQKLYEELKVEVRVFQQRLEGANYRVGQLESEVKASVPLLEHQKVLTSAKKEKHNNKILYILLGAVLILQPLWLLLAYL